MFSNISNAIIVTPSGKFDIQRFEFSLSNIVIFYSRIINLQLTLDKKITKHLFPFSRVLDESSFIFIIFLYCCPTARVDDFVIRRVTFSYKTILTSTSSVRRSKKDL